MLNKYNTDRDDSFGEQFTIVIKIKSEKWIRCIGKGLPPKKKYAVRIPSSLKLIKGLE